MYNTYVYVCQVKRATNVCSADQQNFTKKHQAQIKHPHPLDNAIKNVYK